MVGKQYSSRELVAGVDDNGFDCAAVDRALTHDLHVLATLPQIDGDGDNFSARLLTDPTDGNRSVQPARVGEYDAIGHGFCAPSVENLYQRIRGQASDSIMAASSAPESGSRATTKMVSSPAIVPTMSGIEDRSSALAR